MAGQGPSIRTMAVWAQGQSGSNFEYALSGTPCETVVNKELCCYPRDVQQRFPEDQMLLDLGAESYVGAPLFDSAGRPLGLMAVLFCHPLDDCRAIESLLRLYAVRAAAEIDRQQVDQRLRESERRYRTIIDNIGIGIVQMSPTGKTIYANPAMCAMFEVESLSNWSWEDYKPFFTPESWETILREEPKRPQGVSSTYEVEIIGKRGGRRRTLIFGAPLFDANGRFHGYISTHTDLTVQKKAEEELGQQEARVRLVVEQMPAILWSTDSQFHITSSLGKGLTALGLQPGQMVGTNLLDYLNDASPDHLAMSATERALKGESVFYKGDFLGRSYECHIEPLRNSDQQITGTIGIAVDVTDRLQTEEKLRGIETRYQTLAEVSPVGIFRTDAQGNLVYANGRALRMIGQTLAEVIQPGWRPPLHPEDCERHQAAWSAAIASGVPLYAEHRFLRPDGSIVWVVSQAVAERQPDGKVIGFVGTLTDITQLKRAEERLRQSEHRNRLLVETARDVIFTLAPDRTIASLSPAFKTITGFEVTDWLGKPFEALVHPDDLALSSDMVRRCLQGESSPVHETRIRRKNGDHAVGEFTLTLLLDGGRITGVLGIGRDITDRKKLEDQFRQSQKMEAIGQLAGGVAHDFNNLLTVITGNSELLLGGTILGTRQSQECLQDIKQAGLKAASLTRQLLAFSRKQLMTLEVLDLGSLVTDLQKMLRRLIGEDIDLTTDLAPDLWLVKADPGQMEQVLLNLAVNSRDAMPQGGRLTITAANVVLGPGFVPVHSQFQPGDFVMLAVQDTGCGMDETTRSHIFEPFFTTKEIGKGTGLGLATVYGIITQSNGHIELSSVPGAGTTFRIYLPRYRVPETPSNDPKNAGENGQAFSPSQLRATETVLLVEDEEMVRNLARDFLQQAGHTVLEARHGSEAIRICEQYGASIHLIVTDVVMPQMGGIEMIRRIKTLRPQIKFLYVSGYTDDALIRQGVRTDEVSYLAKPFTGKELISKVGEILSH
jgi:PAS domain S-box-containing protein